MHMPLGPIHPLRMGAGEVTLRVAGLLAPPPLHELQEDQEREEQGQNTHG